MSLFDHQRLNNDTFKLDIERMRKGWYTDKYFVNVAIILETLSKEGYTFQGDPGRLPAGFSSEGINCGDIEVEMQWFTRRPGTSIIVGVDKALTMLQHCTGYFEGDKFIDTHKNLEVWAVQDGCTTYYNDDPMDIQPVLKVRGRYRDFSILETPTLGILGRSSRVATNVYQSLIATRGKPIMFFPARFDIHEVQAADGYAYNIAVQRFNMDYAEKLGPFISTDAQGDWWNGSGGGTVAHASIASFMGDISEAMLAFSRILPVNIPRIALVDFNNNCVKDSLLVCRAMFNEYMKFFEAGDIKTAERYKLYGVRMDTSKSLRDESVPPLGDPNLDMGVTPRLVFNVRQALDSAWKTWDIPTSQKTVAEQYCHSVKIVVSGGFNPERIDRFEKLNVPVDIYAVGSALFDYHGPTITDFTADVVKVKVHGEWIDMAKTGRRSNDNPDLERVW
jgi:nicotinate phosphoribosyltransferase